MTLTAISALDGISRETLLPLLTNPQDVLSWSESFRFRMMEARRDWYDAIMRLRGGEIEFESPTADASFTPTIDKHLVTKAFLTASLPHNLLGSTIHSDTLTGAVVAGDMIVGNGTPKWSRLTKGDQFNILQMGAALPDWSSFLLDGTTGGKTVLAVTNTKVLTLTAAGDYNLTIPATGTAVLGTGAATRVAVWSGTNNIESGPANSAGYLTNNGAGTLSWSATATATAHNLLSATHTDTTPASPSTGDMIYAPGGGSWAALSVVAPNSLLQDTAGVPAWTLTPTGLTSLSATTLYAGTMTLSAGSIVDSSGAISFGDENLTTTGQINALTYHGTTLLVDHIGEHTGAHTVTFDNICGFPAGSAAAPAIAFSGDPNTGVYSAGGDIGGLTAAGQLCAQWNSTTFYPGADNARYLGAGGMRWANIVIGLLTGYAEGANFAMYGQVYSDTAWNYPLYYFDRYRGTYASHANALQSGDYIGGLNFRGWDGTDMEYAAWIYVRTSEAWTHTPEAHGAYISFNTTAIGADGTAERCRINSTGIELLNNHDLLSLTGGGSDLGTATYYFGSVYATTHYADHIAERTGAHTITLDNNVTASGNVTLANTKDILAATAGGSDLGATGTGWGDIYLDTTHKVQFRDSGLNIASLDDGRIDITFDTGLDFNLDSNRIAYIATGGITLEDTKDVLCAVAGGTDLGSSGTGWGDIYLDTTHKTQYRDSGVHIASLDDGHLDLTADTEIDFNNAANRIAYVSSLGLRVESGKKLYTNEIALQTAVSGLTLPDVANLTIAASGVVDLFSNSAAFKPHFVIKSFSAETPDADDMAEYEWAVIKNSDDSTYYLAYRVGSYIYYWTQDGSWTWA